MDGEEGDSSEEEDAQQPGAGDARPLDEEVEHFDITLAATHAYMGTSLSAVRGGAASAVCPGWRGCVLARAARAVVFPGEAVPLHLTDSREMALFRRVAESERLFVLLWPDATEQHISPYGALCEILEVGASEEREGPAGWGAAADLDVRARAIHRARLVTGGERLPLSGLYAGKLIRVQVEVLYDSVARAPLHHARLASLDRLRRRRGGRGEWRDAGDGEGEMQRQKEGEEEERNARVSSMIRRMDAAVSPWPHWVYAGVDYERLRGALQRYFATRGVARALPSEAVSLSYWVSSNLVLSARARLRLFRCDDALLRLRMAHQLAADEGGTLACGACRGEVARGGDVFAMSSDGVHSNYTNPGGHMHDVVTVRSVTSLVRYVGAASDEYSWFPGYSWRVLVCAACHAHLGWKFKALRPALRPQRFYGLCRDYLHAPRDYALHAPRDYVHAPSTTTPPPDADTDDAELSD